MLSKKSTDEDLDRSSRSFDAVTNLLDRPTLIHELTLAITQIKSGQRCVFGVANVEQFKLINHCYGNAAGDFVLQEIANRMNIEFGDSAIIGRMGNDEFGFYYNR